VWTLSMATRRTCGTAGMRLSSSKGQVLWTLSPNAEVTWGISVSHQSSVGRPSVNGRSAVVVVLEALDVILVEDPERDL
jgi:hypothetical protein